MILICPAGPPKLMKPSLSQYRQARRNETGAVFPTDVRMVASFVHDIFMMKPDQTLE
jgi:hypothetical protein